MAKELISLSSVSSRKIAWMTKLSKRLTLNFTFALLWLWASPSCAFSKSPGCNYFKILTLSITEHELHRGNNVRSKGHTFRSLMNLSKCWRTPLRSSWTNSLLWQGIFVASKMQDPIFGSETPKLNLGFLPSFTFGRFNSRKLLSSSLMYPSSFNANTNLKTQKQNRTE